MNPARPTIVSLVTHFFSISYPYRYPYPGTLA
jgi:hypothetical protein